MSETPENSDGKWLVRRRRHDDVHSVELQIHPLQPQPGSLYLTREEAIMLAAELLSVTEDAQT